LTTRFREKRNEQERDQRDGDEPAMRHYPDHAQRRHEVHQVPRQTDRFFPHHLGVRDASIEAGPAAFEGSFEALLALVFDRLLAHLPRHRHRLKRARARQPGEATVRDRQGRDTRAVHEHEAEGEGRDCAR